MIIRIDLPLEAIEPIFNALHTIKPNSCSRVEHRAISLLKTTLYFELEKIMETDEEKYEREINFKELFHEQRRKREQKDVGESEEVSV